MKRIEDLRKALAHVLHSFDEHPSQAPATLREALDELETLRAEVTAAAIADALEKALAEAQAKPVDAAQPPQESPK